MAVHRCHICDRNPAEKRRLNGTGLQDGVYCPVCNMPTCSHHLTVVRWRWKDAHRQLDSAQVCRECRRTYRHRSWDPLHRDWIS